MKHCKLIATLFTVISTLSALANPFCVIDNNYVSIVDQKSFDQYGMNCNEAIALGEICFSGNIYKAFKTLRSDELKQIFFQFQEEKLERISYRRDYKSRASHDRIFYTYINVQHDYAERYQIYRCPQ